MPIVRTGCCRTTVALCGQRYCCGYSYLSYLCTWCTKASGHAWRTVPGLLLPGKWRVGCGMGSSRLCVGSLFRGLGSEAGGCRLMGVSWELQAVLRNAQYTCFTELLRHKVDYKPGPRPALFLPLSVFVWLSHVTCPCCTQLLLLLEVQDMGRHYPLPAAALRCATAACREARHGEQEPARVATLVAIV